MAYSDDFNEKLLQCGGKTCSAFDLPPSPLMITFDEDPIDIEAEQQLGEDTYKETNAEGARSVPLPSSSISTFD
jgi:hypothetical protein